MRGKLRFAAIAALCGRVIAHPDEYDLLTQIMVGGTVAVVAIGCLVMIVNDVGKILRGGEKNNN